MDNLFEEMKKAANESMQQKSPEEIAAEAKVAEDAKLAEEAKAKTEVVKEDIKDPNEGREQKPELNDDLVKQYLSGKLGVNIDDLSTIGKKEELKFASPEVEALNTYVSETKRGIQDYLKIQRNWDEVDNVTLAREKYLADNPEMTPRDFEVLNKLHLKPLEGEDYTEEEKQVRAMEIELRDIKLKEQAAAAKRYFGELNDKLKTPLERAKSEAEAKSNELLQGQERWKQSVTEAAKEFDLGIEGYDAGLTPEALVNKYSSIENILNNFKDDSGNTDVKSLIRTIELGQQFSKVKDFLMQKQDATTKTELINELENSGDVNIKRTGEGGELPEGIQELGAMLDAHINKLKQ